jgi:hypothetical protein
MKKISMFFLAMMSLACVTMFSSCNKDEETTTKVKYEGTLKIYVRGYSIGTSGSDYYPNSVKKKIYSPVANYKITFENGKVFTSNGNGVIEIKLEAGEYVIKSIELPAGYYPSYNSDYLNGKYIYTFPEEEDEDYYYGYDDRYYEIYPGYEETIISLYTK